MNSKFFFLGLILIAIISLFLISTSKTPVVKAQSPIAEPVYILTPTAPSSPTPSSYITPFVPDPGPIVERPFTPTPTFTVQPTPPIANLTGPIQYIPPTNTPTSTPTPTVLPTIGIAGFIPTVTPTPKINSFPFGRKDKMLPAWNKVEKLLQLLMAKDLPFLSKFIP